MVGRQPVVMVVVAATIAVLVVLSCVAGSGSAGAPAPLNLLLGQPARVSSTLSGGEVDKGKQHITDGKTTHKSYARGYWHSSETKTTAFSPHYAEVLLAAPAAVGLVRIWNRADCCDDRINGAIVRARDEDGELHPCDGAVVTAGKGAAVDVSCDTAGSSSGPAPLIVAIRVELHTDVPLQIVELEAFPSRRAAAAAAAPSKTKPAAADAAAAGAGSEDVDEDFSWEDDDADGGAASCAAGVRGWSPLAVEAWLRSKRFDAMAAKCAGVGSVDGTQLLALAADAAALVAGGYGVDTRLHQRRLRLEVESAVKQSSGGCDSG